ncbi:endonuclease domain-containing protein [Leucobacter japonicus]|uniref:endonuclease domain-containing protein n=1 Tax=Leucobacter japonicus TaxID=1461259 RepID=UPI0009496AB6|nr:DUF559 domain-containing protein [Leucobacter japonicus]
MELQAEMRRAGGVIRARELFERGITVHQLRTACARRQVVRPARGWVALPDADSDLVHALQHGMSITCVSLAQRLGLWVRHADQPHLAARSPHAHAQADCGTVHWGRPVFRREPFAVVDSIENALNYIARCQPYEEALAIWESALQQELVSKDALVRLPYRGTARRVLETCTLFSGSGLESYVLRRLRALRLHVVPQAWVLGRRVDFLIERNVVLEVDGATHTGRQRDRDNVSDVRHTLAGYVVIRVSYRQIFEDWPEVQRLIMAACSQC